LYILTVELFDRSQHGRVENGSGGPLNNYNYLTWKVQSKMPWTLGYCEWYSDRTYGRKRSMCEVGIKLWLIGDDPTDPVVVWSLLLEQSVPKMW